MNEADDFQDQQVDKYIADLVPRTADYMIAALRIYRDKVDLALISGEKGLLPDVLKKWVSFLEPTAEVRPYLQEWDSANSGSGASVAQSYQKRIEEGRALVAAQQQRLRLLRRRRQNMPAARREGPDRFFNEAWYRGHCRCRSEREAVLTVDAREAGRVAKAVKSWKRRPPERK
jgi:hypothetical protein